MHLQTMLKKILGNVMHQKRLATLTCLVQSTYHAKNMSLTQLGRSIDLPIQERSGIRRADRFLGNEKLAQERSAIYGVLMRYLVGNKKRPLILVDWTKLPHSHYCLLRASLVKSGRSQTLYEKVHEQSQEANAAVHREFLNELKAGLPQDCRPILISDAGFQNPWFEWVILLGWDYVGRVRGSGNKLYRGCNGDWRRVKDLFVGARSSAQTLGQLELAKTNPLLTWMYRIKEKAKGRHHRRRDGRQRTGRMEREQSKSAKEGLLLASSLKSGYGRASQVVRIYKQRMQIEENFRDMKSSSYGLGLSAVRTESKLRWQHYLLLILIASFWAWLVGYSVERENRHWQFQANSVKSRRVLSLFYLGCRAIKRNMTLRYEVIESALEYLGDLHHV